MLLLLVANEYLPRMCCIPEGLDALEAARMPCVDMPSAIAIDETYVGLEIFDEERDVLDEERGLAVDDPALTESNGNACNEPFVMLAPLHGSMTTWAAFESWHPIAFFCAWQREGDWLPAGQDYNLVC